jgi:hypothetical protein
MRGRLRLMRCVLRTVRNDTHPRTFRTLVDLDYRDTPKWGPQRETRQTVCDG